MTFKALTSGLGPNINSAIPPVTAASVGNVLIAPSQAGGVYHLPPPGGPSGLNVLSVTSTTASLSWSAPPSGGLPSSYIVQVSPHGSGAWTNVGTVPGSSTSYTVAGLSGGTPYDFQVIASNATGNGAPSAFAATTTLVNPPNAVTSLTASAGSPSYSAVALSWTASAVDGTHAAATSFAVNYGTNGTTWTLASGAWTSGTTATVTGLAHATGYYFQVVASNSGGAGGTVATGSTITTDIAAPNAPAISAVAPVSDGSITKLTVTWAASATDGTHDAATGYDLQYRTNPSGSWTTQTGVTSPVTITGLTVGTSYDVQVRGTNASSTSPGAWSGSTTARTYLNAITMNSAPSTPFAHGTGPGFNVAISPNTNNSNTRAAWGSSAAVAPSSGWSAGSNFSGNLWAWFLSGGASASAGTVYLWVQSRDGSNVVNGTLVTGPHTVT